MRKSETDSPKNETVSCFFSINRNLDKFRINYKMFIHDVKFLPMTGDILQKLLNIEFIRIWPKQISLINSNGEKNLECSITTFLFLHPTLYWLASYAQTRPGKWPSQEHHYNLTRRKMQKTELHEGADC